MKRIYILLSVVVVSSLAIDSCTYDNEEELYPSCDTLAMSYTLDIVPILQSNCYVCHSGGQPSGGFSFDSYPSFNGVVNNPNGDLFCLLKQEDEACETTYMPPNGRLSDCLISKIEAWVNQGALDN